MLLHYKTFIVFFLIASTFLSGVIGRDLIIPSLYIPLYLVSVILFISSGGKLKKSGFFTLFFLVILCMQLFSLFNIDDFKSSLIYQIMWLVNVFFAYTVVYYDRHNILIKSVAAYGVVLIFSFLILILLNIAPSGFYGSLGININLVAFIVVIAFYYFYINGKKLSGTMLSIIGLLTFSRMQVLMVFVFYLEKIWRYRLFRFILIFLGMILVYLSINVMAESSLFRDFLYYLNNGKFIFSEHVDDQRRIYLLLAAMETIKNLFPMGTGLGLENFKYYAERFIVDAYSGDVRLSMTHNFYLSYLATTGVMFFALLGFVLYPVLFKSEFRILFFMFLIGIAFNEYITSPFFWLIYGVTLKSVLERRLINSGI